MSLTTHYGTTLLPKISKPQQRSFHIKSNILYTCCALIICFGLFYTRIENNTQQPNTTNYSQIPIQNQQYSAAKFTKLAWEGSIQDTDVFPITFFNQSIHKFTNRLNFPEEIPRSFDWESYGALTPIKYQGHYGSCYSFSAAQTVESAHWLKHSKLMRISPQQLLDCCDTKCSNHKCCFEGDCNYLNQQSNNGGGHFADGFRFWFHKGYVKSDNYPYLYGNCDIFQNEQNCNSWDSCDWVNNSCEIKRKKMCFKPAANMYSGKVKDMIWVSLDQKNGNNEFVHFQSKIATDDEIKAALYQIGPLSIAMDASKLHEYKSGILSPQVGGELNHALQLVGYGTEDGIDYWRIRNSWGPNWGEDGYFRIDRKLSSLLGFKKVIIGAVVE